jgi:uncharacterized membrane protein YphA (DoxX/SURF4 family)
MENAANTSPRTRATGYWIATALAALLFAVPGAGLLGRVPHFTQEMARLGYPLYFLSFLGIWKILGAVTIVIPRFPRVKEWAYAGMMFDIAGAVVSHLATGDEAVKVVLPFAIAGVVATSWALRPEGRVLPSRDTVGREAQNMRTLVRQQDQRPRATL